MSFLVGILEEIITMGYPWSKQAHIHIFSFQLEIQH